MRERKPFRVPDPFALTLLLVVGLLLVLLGPAVAGAQEDFGSDEDLAYARSLWKAMADYTDWPLASEVYEGRSPHGAWLRMYGNIVPVEGDNLHVIVKDNYAGSDAESVAAAPGDHLKSVTIMAKRPGYAPDHGDWFWVKYTPDGSVERNAGDLPLAGVVGVQRGCVACHANADDGDYVFMNDE